MKSSFKEEIYQHAIYTGEGVRYRQRPFSHFKEEYVEEGNNNLFATGIRREVYHKVQAGGGRISEKGEKEIEEAEAEIDKHAKSRSKRMRKLRTIISSERDSGE